MNRILASGVAQEMKAYVGNIQSFDRWDWIKYLSWMGTIFSLLIGLIAFFSAGLSQGVVYPGYVWFILLGTAMFASSLAFDDIGHRTLYKENLKMGEGYVHRMIVFTAVPSVMALCLCYEHPDTFMVPAIALIALSFFYSAVDEALHWQRYLKYGLDRVEMWSHFTAITGHVLMISCWWHWFREGYPGVNETLKVIFG